MNWNKWVRQTHRWLSIAFTVAVIVNGVAVAQRSAEVKSVRAQRENENFGK